ncbi:CoA-binding protein [Phytoactinopolyspora alkaliphila]|uniref:CoA-binding protein n=1 Tax=Phytoactinopolyspora alkaliphila TaxID=1783498 RepID=A0A6N9YGY8_9ACTN|nr:CoA-binding protein [Phytoactinopolyspora alkaliphila]NED94311.1 CoA-binding protein [Phytoactinopolyspora alkaliphila]
MTHSNDPDLVRRLLTTPATWAVVGLSANKARVAHGVAGFIKDGLGMRIVPVNPRSEDAHGETGYARLADVPAPVDVVDCFVNSSRVGTVIDDAIAERERLGISAVWLQLGVIDDDAAQRARDAGLDVVMDTCPAIEAPRLGL